MEKSFKDIGKEFDWTNVVGKSEVEPWGVEKECWFEGLPTGWADVIYEYVCKLDRVLRDYDLVDYLYIEQVKEKWGGLRFYYNFIDFDHNFREFSEKQNRGIKIFDEIVTNMEVAVEEVCCDCGTREGVTGYGGWVHFSCPECENKRLRKWWEGVEEYRRYKDEMS